MSTNKRDVIFPAGRIVMGSLYKSSDKDADGKPRIVKSGPNQGQATQQFFFAVAYPKTQAHWAHEIWGKDIWEVGNAAFPGIAANPAFAWKIVDGDSVIPNKKGIAPATREGYKGHWVVSFSSTFAPKVVKTDGSGYLLEVDAVLAGDFVQVSANVDGNGSTQNPGVYINHGAVRFLGYSAEGRITQGADPLQTQWGIVAMPVGMVSTPPAGIAAPPAAAAPAPAALPPAAPIGLPGFAPAAAPLPLAPSPGFMAPPPAAMPPPVAMPPPAAPVRAMTAKAAGNTYEGLIAQGWSDALLVQHGMMTA